MDLDLCHCNGEEISQLNKFIFLLSVVPFTLFSSLIIASIFVEKYVWRPSVKKSLLECIDLMETEKQEEQEIYTDKYKLEKTEDEIDHDEEYFKGLSVIENTPKGNVIMEYNKNDEIWLYYADKKYKNNITFDELDTVCRKYCKTFKCSNLYIDRKIDIEEQKKRQEELKKQPNEKKQEQPKNKDDDLFVNVKVSTNKPVKSRKISATNSNKYKYKGEINEFWAFNITHEKKPKIDEKLGWSLWKTKKN
jgi:hypothetical protein